MLDQVRFAAKTTAYVPRIRSAAVNFLVRQMVARAVRGDSLVMLERIAQSLGREVVVAKRACAVITHLLGRFPGLRAVLLLVGQRLEV